MVLKTRLVLRKDLTSNRKIIRKCHIKKFTRERSLSLRTLEYVIPTLNKRILLKIDPTTGFLNTYKSFDNKTGQFHSFDGKIASLKRLSYESYYIKWVNKGVLFKNKTFVLEGLKFSLKGATIINPKSCFTIKCTFQPDYSFVQFRKISHENVENGKSYWDIKYDEGNIRNIDINIDNLSLSHYYLPSGKRWIQSWRKDRQRITEYEYVRGLSKEAAKMYVLCFM